MDTSEQTYGIMQTFQRRNLSIIGTTSSNERIVLKDDALRNIETLYMVINTSAVSVLSSSENSTPRVRELVEKLRSQLSIQPSSENPASGREKFWKKMFGDEPMPTSVKDAAIKNAGSLSDDLDTVTDDDIADVLTSIDE